jgi:hypothetical protein
MPHRMSPTEGVSRSRGRIPPQHVGFYVKRRIESTCVPAAYGKVKNRTSDVAQSCLCHVALESLADSRIPIGSFHRAHIRLVPPRQRRLTCQPPAPGLYVRVVFDHLKPTVRLHQSLHIADIGCPSICFDPLGDEPRMYKVVRVAFKYFRVIESVVQIVTEQ